MYSKDTDTWDNGCTKTFIKKTHNQIFCNSECTRVQTNANIMDNYYEKKKIKNGETRICVQCNFTRLSIWNDGKICASCERMPEKKRSDEARKIINSLGGCNVPIPA